MSRECVRYMQFTLWDRIHSSGSGRRGLSDTPPRQRVGSYRNFGEIIYFYFYFYLYFYFYSYITGTPSSSTASGRFNSAYATPVTRLPATIASR
jgi:hypothetical protein